MISLARGFAVVVLAWGSLGAAVQLFAQEGGWDSQQVELSRADLEALLVRYEQTIASTAYSRELRDQARREAALIRTRLEEGDFQVGDRIALSVEGEDALTNTFLIQAGPALLLPEIGRVSLSGVLRSELVPHLQAEVARFIRNPAIQARTSVRLVVTGGVGSPGYHVVPISTVFSDVLMIAGAPAPDARLQEIRVERADRIIWSGEALQQGIIEGRTLDQLSIRAGDHIVVPQQRASTDLRTLLRLASMTAGPVAMLGGLLVALF